MRPTSVARCGERADRRRWREEGGERVAAVYIFKAALTAAENIGHRNRGDTQNQSLYISVTKANTTPADPTISQALLSSDSKASFYAQNLMGFERNTSSQPIFTKPCLTILAIFVVSKSVDAPTACRRTSPKIPNPPMRFPYREQH